MFVYNSSNINSFSLLTQPIFSAYHFGLVMYLLKIFLMELKISFKDLISKIWNNLMIIQLHS